MATNEPVTNDMLTDDEREIITEEYIRNVKRELAKALAEVAHLRAREQALAAENAAMRPVVEAVTEDTTDSETGDCCFCGWSGYPHERNCPTAQARAFVAAHPATDTAAGEAESEA